MIKGEDTNAHTIYTVQQGDTLWQIALQEYPHTKKDIRAIIYDIKQMNHFEQNEMLLAGEEILLPLYEKETQ